MIGCRLLIDEPAAGAWNMAVDEALVEGPGQQELVLRLYGWREPTLSLGYFQSLADRARHPASAQCALVRRLSGGGAILHDRELTYALAAPKSYPLTRQAEALYLAIHETLVAALGKLGIEASINSRPSELTPAEEPFLCFERRAKGDVLYGTAKIAGSAERRRRGAILQHGSILLARSLAAPELAGLGELCGRPVERAPLIAAWLEELERGLGWRFLHSSLTKDEVRLAEQLAAQRFELTSWNSRR